MLYEAYIYVYYTKYRHYIIEHVYSLSNYIIENLI